MWPTVLKTRKFKETKTKHIKLTVNTKSKYNWMKRHFFPSANDYK